MTGGTVATSDPRATEAAAGALRAGGNAVDAAVAAAFVLFVVEPHACGVGGDAFVLVTRPGLDEPMGLDGSGAIPGELALAAEQDTGFRPIERSGSRSVTTPGAVHMLERLVHDHGVLPVAGAIAPACALADDGFEVRPTLAEAAERNAQKLAGDPVLAPLYMPNGKPVSVGDVVMNPDLASALENIGAEGAATLYEGPLSWAISDLMAATGGYLHRDDLALHRTETMKPASVDFRGYQVWELPEPTQGPAVLAALSELEGMPNANDESVAEAIVRGLRTVGLDLGAAGRSVRNGVRGDTTYIAAADENGLVVSLITSVFTDFGSGVGVKSLGAPLQNRAYGSTLLNQRPKRGKPPHTTIPGLVTGTDGFSAAVGVVGGYMQAQGQVQVLVNLLLRHMDPKAAVDAPRFRVVDGPRFALEPDHPLVSRYADGATTDPGPGGFGGANLVIQARGELSGASDRRRGGAVGAV